MEQEIENPQFDSFLGGKQKLPAGVNLSEFIKHRMEEVVMLTEAIKESPFRGQTFQRLPKHMRRRQMSHHIKRLPRRLQRPYLMTLKEGVPAPTKCPSRKYRRRPGNLLLEYNRRQKKSVWLETHIWHAKRFHMTEKWGYKLPERPVNKSFKACYRAISEHCLLTDNSYYNCIELRGPEAQLLEGLKQCNSDKCGLTFGAKMYLSGAREGSVTLFHPNSYPYGAIGNVTFMWKPLTGSNEERTIWIWVHPLMHEEAATCFRNLFGLIMAESASSEVTEAMNVECEKGKIKELSQNKRKKKEKKSKKRMEVIKLEPKNVPFVRTPKYANQSESITMTLLKDTLNRFQLTGPLSQAIVSQAFTMPRVFPVEEELPEVEFMEVESKRRKIDVGVTNWGKKGKGVLGEEQEDAGEGSSWWEEYYSDGARKEAWNQQRDFYRKLSECSKPTDVPPGMILSVVVEDPRLRIPFKREKAAPQITETRQIPGTWADPGLSKSPIWEPGVRDRVSQTKLTTQEINEARSRKIVPGSDLGGAIPDRKRSRIPILLVQRPGRRESRFGKLGLGSGWDIISPAGFGMPIWLSLVFRGARTGGLRECEMLRLERNQLSGWPQPDSAAGESDAQSKKQKLKERYFRLPPNKRANYVKLGVLTPFYRPWKVLARDWTPEAERVDPERQKFSVLRDRKVLAELEELVAKHPKRQGLKGFAKRLLCGTDFLVPVAVEYAGKGKPQDFALICIPENEDFEDLSGTKAGPAEPPHVDGNESLRKMLRADHSRELTSLRRKRKRERAKLREEFANDPETELEWKDTLKSDLAASTASSEGYKAKMASLWVPEVDTVGSLVDSCRRRIAGFVVLGNFSLSKACGVALGYVALPGLMEAANVCARNNSESVVLVRNRNSAQYRFGKLRLAVE